MALVIALSVSGCDGFVAFCAKNPNGTFKLGGTEVKCSQLTKPHDPNLFIEITSEEPVRVNQTVTFKATNPVPQTQVEWDLDSDGAYDDGTGLFAQHVYEIPTQPGEPNESAEARLVDSFGNFVPPGVGLGFRVEPADSGPSPPGEPPPGEQAPGRARTGAAAGQRFISRLELTVFPETAEAKGKGGAARVRNAFGVGRLTGKLRGGRARGAPDLTPFLSSNWLVRYSGSLRRSGRIAIRGLALVHFSELDGESCVRVRLRGSEEDPGQGKMRILGGSGSAGELGGKARLDVSLRRNGRLTLKGTFSQRAAQPGTLPAACAPLEDFTPP